MAAMHMQAGQPDDALPMATEVFGAHLEILGQDHLSTLVSMTNLAQVHMAMRNDENAVSLFRDALSLQRRAGGDADESTLTTVALLGELLGLMGQHTEAVPLLEEGAAGWLQLGGSGHPQTQKCLEHLSLNERFAKDPLLAANFRQFRALKKESRDIVQARNEALALC